MKTGKAENRCSARPARERARLLKPSPVLYLLVSMAVLSLLAILAALFLPAGFAASGLGLLSCMVLGSGLIGLMTHGFARRAESKGTPPGRLFVADIEREKRRYGPLKANRLFGHPIGKDER